MGFNSYLLFITASLLLYFFIGWAIHKYSKKLAWVDFFWSSAFTLIALLTLTNQNFDLPLIYSSAGLYLLWSLRLSIYLFKRILIHSEDGRYISLKENWNKYYNIKSGLFFLFQAILVLILSIPMYLQFKFGQAESHYYQYLSVVIFLVGVIGGSISDFQLSQFKMNAPKGSICNIGLWKYSRHPNYFFEIITWFGLSLSSFHLDYGYLSLIPAVLMFIFIRYLTGVPPSEAQAIKSRGDRYREYQSQTNILLPLPRKGSK